MKKIGFQYQNMSGLNQQQLIEFAHQTGIEQEITHLNQALKVGYESHYASLHCSFDIQNLQKIKYLVFEKQKLKPRILVVIGIGGSNLGTVAVHQALFGRFYNAADPELKIYFAATVDSDKMAEIMRVVQQTLQAGKTVLLNVVTKSGTTMETIINFQTLLTLLKKYRPTDYQELVVVATDHSSKLWHIAVQEQFALLEIPSKVGGRYSVFSAVSLFPLGLCGVDLDQLLEGARLGVLQCIKTDIAVNPAAASALLLYYWHQNGISIHDTFLFALDLQGIGYWYRQLMAESIGKEHNKNGEQVLAGMTPTVSLGSIDLHSVAQLYLGGPRDKFTTFITVAKNNQIVTIPEAPELQAAFPGLQGRTFTSIMDALTKGTQAAYYKNNRPFCSVILPEKNERFLGQFLQFKMIEIMYLGFLLHVDPFDQPNVELYKNETRIILGM